MLSGGYDATNCAAAADLVPGSIAVVDCTQNPLEGGPSSARYFLYANASDLAKQFTSTIGANVTFPCEKGQPAPQEWHYEASPNVTAGQASCGTLNGTPKLVWTNTANLVMATAQGSDINVMFQWWLANG